MSRNSAPVLERSRDWAAARIVYELKLRGFSFRQLAREHGYAPNTLWNVTRVSWPRGEAIVAAALGIRIDEIWPSRARERRDRLARQKGETA
jgi:Ner family transcriptional regulator